MKEINGFILSDDLTVITDYKGDEKEVILPKGVKEISQYALMDKGFTKVTLNDELEVIGFRGLQGNEIEEIILPKNVIEVSSCAFNVCYSLKKITILNPKAYFVVDCFDHCYEITDIYFNGTYEELRKAFYDEGEESWIYLSNNNVNIHLEDGSIIKFNEQ